VEAFPPFRLLGSNLWPEMARNGRKKLAVEILALAIASGESLAASAKLAKIGERTARRWAAAPAFRRRVEELRAAIVDEAQGKLTASITRASDTIVALLSDPSAQIKLAAARAILDYRSRLKSEGELADRVNELERLVAELRDEPLEMATGQADKRSSPDGREGEEGETDEAP
jgi:hypothetical protein